MDHLKQTYSNKPRIIDFIQTAKAKTMFIRAYLRASTKEQDASRARADLEAFASEKDLKIAAFYIENESGASLKRPKLFELIEASHQGDILLIEHVDRLSRLNESDWQALKQALSAKQIKVVAIDLPTSHMMIKPADEFTGRMFDAINGMMLDMLAAIARKDYTTRRERSAQGIQKAKAAGKYQGRVEDVERNLLIQKHLRGGHSSWIEIMELMGCSRGTVAKQAAILKAETA